LVILFIRSILRSIIKLGGRNNLHLFQRFGLGIIADSIELRTALANALYEMTIMNVVRVVIAAPDRLALADWATL